MPPSNKLGSWQAWAVCLSAGLFFLYEFFQLNMLDVLNPLLRQELHWNASRFSVLSSAFLWANFIALLPAGWCLDRFSVRYVVLVGMLGCLLGVAGFAVGESFIVLWIGRFLMGLGNAVCFLACVTLVSRWFSAMQQGLLVGLMVTMAFLGGVLAHTPFAYWVTQVGWRAALWQDVFVGSVFWIIMWGVIRDAPEGSTQSGSTRPKAKSGVALRQPQVYLAGLYASFLNLPIMVLGALWGVSYLETAYQVPLMQATFIASLLLVGSMIGCPVLGGLSDRMQRRKPVMWLGVMGSAACFLPLWFGVFHDVWLLGVLFLGVGFFTSAQVISYPLVAAQVPAAQVGAATAAASCLIMGSALVGQVLFGEWLQASAGQGVSHYTVENFQQAMWMFFIALCFSGILVGFIREPASQP